MGTSQEEILAQLEEELEELEAGQSTSSGYGSPTPEKKDNMFKFFKEMVNLKESWKVGNLNDTEIGQSGLSIRSNLDMANYLTAEGWDKVAEFFTRQAEIVAEPTLGRKGFMAKLFVTQIKKEQKLKEPTAKRKGLFGGKKDEPSEE